MASLFEPFDRLDNALYSKNLLKKPNCPLLVARKNNEIYCYSLPIAVSRPISCKICGELKKIGIPMRFNYNQHNTNLVLEHAGPGNNKLVSLYIDTNNYDNAFDLVTNQINTFSLQYSNFEFHCISCFQLSLSTEGFNLSISTYGLIYESFLKQIDDREKINNIEKFLESENPDFNIIQIKQFINEVENVLKSKTINIAPCLKCMVLLERLDGCSNLKCKCGKWICVNCWKISDREVFHEGTCFTDSKWKNFLEHKPISIQFKVPQPNIEPMEQDEAVPMQEPEMDIGIEEFLLDF